MYREKGNRRSIIVVTISLLCLVVSIFFFVLVHTDVLYNDRSISKQKKAGNGEKSVSSQRRDLHDNQVVEIDQDDTKSNEKEKVSSKEEEELTQALDEYLGGYEDKKEVRSTEQNIDGKEVGIVGYVGGYYVRSGETVVIEGYEGGTWNPRPRTEEEKRRYNELCYELDRLHEMAPTHPGPERRAYRERIKEIHAELKRINAETSYPTYVRTVISMEPAE